MVGVEARKGGCETDLGWVAATPPLDILRMGEADPSRCDFKALDLTICFIKGSSFVMIEAIVSY